MDDEGDSDHPGCIHAKVVAFPVTIKRAGLGIVERRDMDVALANKEIVDAVLAVESVNIKQSIGCSKMLQEWK